MCIYDIYIYIYIYGYAGGHTIQLELLCVSQVNVTSNPRGPAPSRALSIRW